MKLVANQGNFSGAKRLFQGLLPFPDVYERPARDYVLLRIFRSVGSFDGIISSANPQTYSTVTLFARLRGWSTSQPRRMAM
jgi:hypothetical protein